jgi:hypothetical protein
MILRTGRKVMQIRNEFLDILKWVKMFFLKVKENRSS